VKRKKVIALAVAMFVLVSSCCCCFSGGDWDDWEDFDWEDYDWDMRSLPWLLTEVSVYVVTLPLMAFAGS
jgi:hypothetical protein